MALGQCGGADVLRGKVHMPKRGAWKARFRLDTMTAPTGAVTIAFAGGITLEGMIVDAETGLFLDAVETVVVAGAGGLASPVSGAFQSAQLGDVLASIAGQAAETLSPAIDSSVLGVLLAAWSLGGRQAAYALDDLAAAAGSALGQEIGWRLLSDGTLWMGAETWPMVQPPAGTDVLSVARSEGKFVLGVETPTLVPGINFAATLSDGSTVGNVTAVDHWIAPDQIRTWAWTSTPLNEQFVETVRSALSMEPDPGMPPIIDYLAFYRAEVRAVSVDGSLLDVAPEDPRIEAQQGVPMRLGIPGLQVIVKTGAVVLLGWEKGDPSRPYCAPLWEAGAGVAKLVLGGDNIQLGGDGGDAVVTRKDLQVLANAINSASVVPNDGGAALKANILAALSLAGWSTATPDGNFGSSKVKAKR